MTTTDLALPKISFPFKAVDINISKTFSPSFPIGGNLTVIQNYSNSNLTPTVVLTANSTPCSSISDSNDVSLAGAVSLPSMPTSINSSRANSYYNMSALSSFDLTPSNIPSINQSVSGGENDSVFALCLPDKILPTVKRLEHIQSQTPRNLSARIPSSDIDINNKTNLITATSTLTAVDHSRKRSRSACPSLNTTDEMVNIEFKPIDIASPTLKQQLKNKHVVKEVIAPTNNISHHRRESTPIHKLTKSDGNPTEFVDTENLSSIEKICIQIATEEKEAIAALVEEVEEGSISSAQLSSTDKYYRNDDSSTMDDKYSMSDTQQTEEDFLLEQGYEKLQTLTKTLQGCVFKARNLNLLLNLNTSIAILNNRKKNKRRKSKYSIVVIKRTNKNLYSHGITIQDGKQYSVKEDIIKEMKLMKHCLQYSPPAAMIQFLGFFESSTNYYLVMEDGGVDCFDFVVEAHEHIAEGRLKLKEWRKFCKFLFWQMTLFLKWLHYDVKCCHLDISLENLLLQNAKFIPKSKGSNQLTLSPHVQIKFCDFGLAEFFDFNDVGDFRCTKYCGKANYKAPQVYHKEGIFDARKADIWSLGIVFFSMVIGAPPYIKPILGRVDDTYDYVERGCIAKLLYDWERNDYVTLRMLNLMNGMLTVKEDERLTIIEIVEHPWLNLYKEQYSNHLKQSQQHLKKKKNKKLHNSYSIRDRSLSHNNKKGCKDKKKPKFSIMYQLDFPKI